VPASGLPFQNSPAKGFSTAHLSCFLSDHTNYSFSLTIELNINKQGCLSFSGVALRLCWLPRAWRFPRWFSFHIYTSLSLPATCCLVPLLFVLTRLVFLIIGSLVLLVANECWYQAAGQQQRFMSTDGLIDRARKTSLVSVVAEAVSLFSDTPVFPKISTPMINASVPNDNSCLCVAANDCQCF